MSLFCDVFKWNLRGFMVVLELYLYYFLYLIYVMVFLFIDLWCIFICGFMVLFYFILDVELLIVEL